MKKIICLMMALIITIISTLGNSIDVFASEVESTETAMTQEDFTAGMAIPFTMIETFLYAISGQQAVDTYMDDEENQQALHQDFCDWLDTQKKGLYLMTHYSLSSLAIKHYLHEYTDYYKTNGSSALAGASEQAQRDFKLIVGGGNSDNNENNDNNGNLDKALSLGVSTGWLELVSDYTDEVVKGNRGEVSETFLNGGEKKPVVYYDGTTNIDENGLLTLDIFGDVRKTASYANDVKYYNGLLQIRYNVPDTYEYPIIRYAFCTAWGKTLEDDVSWYGLSTYVRVCNPDTLNTYTKLYSTSFEGWSTKASVYKSGELLGTVSGQSDGWDLEFSKEALKNMSGMAVFDNETDLNNYLEHGDYSGAVNYHNLEKKEGYYDFPLSNISDKLDEIIKALNNLPLITTDSLKGFAQGVNGAVVGAIPGATPAQQEQTVKQAMEDAAKDVVREYYVAESAKSEDELIKETGATPKPTATPNEVVTQKNAKMMVDLHDFFPFCVPYDLVHLIKVLKAEPKAPCFEYTFKYEPLDISETIKLDLAPFEPVVKIVRVTETILFILALILVSRSLIRG